MARRFDTRAPRITKHWDATGLRGAAQHDANGTALHSTLVFTTPHTILRCRGNWYMGPSVATVALEEATIAIAIGIVSADAAVAGAGSLPDPFDEPNYPWLWYDVARMFSPFVVDGTGSDDFGVTVNHRILDSKAMRKIKPGQALVLVSQMSQNTGTPQIRCAADVRVLVGEP